MFPQRVSLCPYQLQIAYCGKDFGIYLFLLRRYAWKVSCYKTVENWIKKLGFSIYKDDRKVSLRNKYAMIVDESIMINVESS